MLLSLSATECKERWKNIRAVFVRHMKPSKSGSGTKEKKAYYLSDALQFTVPFIKALGKHSGNLSQPPQKEEEEHVSKDGSEFVNGENLLSDNTSPSPSPLQPSKPSTSISSSTAAFPQAQHQDLQSEPVKVRPLQNKRRMKENEVDNAFLEYLKCKKVRYSSKQLSTDTREEPLKMFLLSMLPDLLKMDDRQVRQFKRKMLDTVDEILSSSSTCPPSSYETTSNCSFQTEPPPTTDGVGDYTSVEGDSLRTLADYYATAFAPITRVENH